jgi:uncharacterized protein (DUF885 family)
MKPSIVLALALLAASLSVSCKKEAPASGEKARPEAAKPPPPPSARDPGRSPALARLTRAYLDGLFRAKPHLATFMGDHRFDGDLPDLSPAGLARREAVLVAERQELAALSPSLASLDDRLDAEVMRDGIDLELLYLREIREWTWEPRLHDSFPYYDPREIVASRLSDIIHGDFAAVEARVESVVRQLEGLPGFLQEVRAALARPAKLYTEHAIRANAGRITFVEAEVAGFVRGHPRGPAALKVALHALRAYQTFLERDLLPRSDGDWRLGEAKFRKKFPLALQTDLTPEAVIPRAEAAFAKAREALFALARRLHRELWPKDPVPEAKDLDTQRKLVRKVQGELTRDHPKANELVPEHAANLERIRAFIEKHQLLELPPVETLAVKEMPEFKRGATTAEYLAPGILENRPKWQATYYVDPVNPKWPPERIASYLRGNNRYEVELTAIHEAYPGHHVQFAYSKRQLSPLRAVLWNAPMAEGWAVYGEDQMVELGYGGPKNDRYRFFWLMGHMIVATNAILDIKLHLGRMSDEEAVRLMVEEGLQEVAIAERKLTRAKLDSTQLTQYFLGHAEIQELEGDYRRQVGKKYTQRAFNEALLGQGSLAVKYLRSYLLGPAGAPAGPR